MVAREVCAWVHTCPCRARTVTWQVCRRRTRTQTSSTSKFCSRRSTRRKLRGLKRCSRRLLTSQCLFRFCVQDAAGGGPAREPPALRHASLRRRSRHSLPPTVRSYRACALQRDARPAHHRKRSQHEVQPDPVSCLLS